MIDHEQGAGWNSSVDVDDTTTPPHQLLIWSLGSLSSSTGPITVLQDVRMVCVIDYCLFYSLNLQSVHCTV